MVPSQYPEGREGRQFLLRALSVPVLQPAFVQLKLSEPNPYFEADLDAEFTGRGYGQRPGQGYGYGYGFDYPGFYPQIYGYERYRPQGFENSRRGSNGTNVMNNNINSIDVVTSTYHLSCDLYKISSIICLVFQM